MHCNNDNARKARFASVAPIVPRHPKQVPILIAYSWAISWNDNVHCHSDISKSNFHIQLHIKLAYFQNSFNLNILYKTKCADIDDLVGVRLS